MKCVSKSRRLVLGMILRPVFLLSDLLIVFLSFVLQEQQRVLLSVGIVTSHSSFAAQAERRKQLWNMPV
jgi:hypothetical protein